MTDVRSALAVKITDANPRAYEKLVVEDSTPARARELLDGVTADQLLAVPVQDPVAAQAMLAALWLWHDALTECHQIVQKSPEDLIAAGRSGLNVLPAKKMESLQARDPRSLQQLAATLAFWHAIMHRREGDFSNSKYWYARCADHPILTSLAASAGQLVNSMPADKPLLKLIANGWNPNAFVDLVEQVHDHANDPRHALAVSLQRLEWQTLFNHCTRAAAGS